MKVVPTLIDKIVLKDTDVLCTDKGIDSKLLREQIVKTATKANILKKSNTLLNNECMDLYLYEIRHFGENKFARFKKIRGIAHAMKKLKQNFENSVAFACVFIWLALRNVNKLGIFSFLIINFFKNH